MDLGAANRNPDLIGKLGFAAGEALSDPEVLSVLLSATVSVPAKDGRAGHWF
jgi:hypothetical protein